MRDKRFLITALVIYFSYFMHGMAVITISQHKDFFVGTWANETGAGVAFAISAIGIGKLLTQFLGGWASDRFGRKPMLILGMAMYAVFFFGLVISPNFWVAAVFAALFGVANSIVDGGGYPSLMEIFPKMAGSANVLVKAFIAFGQMLLPLAMGALAASTLPGNMALIVCGAIMVILGIAIILVPFPDYRALAAEEAAAAGTSNETTSASVPGAKFNIEGLVIIFLGFTSLGSFWLAQNSLPDFGQQFAHMSVEASKTLTSTYALGSLISVFVTALLVSKFIKPVYFLVICPAGTILGYLGFALLNTAGAFHVSAFLIGFFASGGLLQLLINVMAEFFPGGKGKITGIVFTAASLASFLIPFITGFLNGNQMGVVIMGLIVCILGLLGGIVVCVRYRQVFSRIEQPQLQH